MNKELSDRFKFVKCRVSCGWSNLLWELCLEIEGCNPPENFEVVQIKEKLGGLRFYTSIHIADIAEIISRYEARSFVLCEECEAPGSRKGGYWIKTLCEEHTKKE